MEKSNNSSRDEEYYSCLVRNFELKFFAGPPAKEICEQELNHAAGCTKALGGGVKERQQTGLYHPFEVSNI